MTASRFAGAAAAEPASIQIVHHGDGGMLGFRWGPMPGRIFNERLQETPECSQEKTGASDWEDGRLGLPTILSNAGATAPHPNAKENALRRGLPQ